MTTNPSLLSPPSPRIATPANVAGLPDEGVATAFIVRLIPSLAVPTRMRLLVTSCGVNVPFPLAQACAVPGQAMASARQVVRQPTVDIIDPPAPYEDADLLLAELDRHYVRGLDGIIFIHAAYTAGEIGAHLGRWLGEHALPVLSCLWRNVSGFMREFGSLALYIWNFLPETKGKSLEQIERELGLTLLSYNLVEQTRPGRHPWRGFSCGL